MKVIRSDKLQLRRAVGKHSGRVAAFTAFNLLCSFEQRTLKAEHHAVCILLTGFAPELLQLLQVNAEHRNT